MTKPALLAALYFLLFTDTATHTDHVSLVENFEGTKTCLACHAAEAADVHASVHYQWKGDASEAVNLPQGPAGKLGGINDFCIYPDINWIGRLTNVSGQTVDGGCAKCHPGLGEKPDASPTQAQLENIDCLICHSDSYKRKTGWVDGSLRFVPDTERMSVSLLEAARHITRPTNDSCLNCHTKAGGGDNFKRGDLSEGSRTASRDLDVHLASTAAGGAGLSCTDCHVTRDHRIAGRGTDLRPRDSDRQVGCTECHSDAPHQRWDIDKHTARVDCTVCHIPEFARETATDMDRRWDLPGVLHPSTGLYEPHMEMMKGVTPVYRFSNGLSRFYIFGEPAEAGPGGRVEMAVPEGSIQDVGAKIHAFKRHQATQPMDPVSRRLLPLKIGIFFQTGDVDRAVEEGVGAVGWQYNGHEYVETERYMGLFHEVAPKERALTCSNCHYGGTRLDFDSLGYTPKTEYNGKPLCVACHEDESDDLEHGVFTDVHRIHTRRFDCSRCHGFSSAN